MGEREVQNEGGVTEGGKRRVEKHGKRTIMTMQSFCSAFCLPPSCSTASRATPLRQCCSLSLGSAAQVPPLRASLALPSRSLARSLETAGTKTGGYESED